MRIRVISYTLATLVAAGLVWATSTPKMQCQTIEATPIEPLVLLETDVKIKDVWSFPAEVPEFENLFAQCHPRQQSGLSAVEVDLSLIGDPIETEQGWEYELKYCTVPNLLGGNRSFRLTTRPKADPIQWSEASIGEEARSGVLVNSATSRYLALIVSNRIRSPWLFSISRKHVYQVLLLRID